MKTNLFSVAIGAVLLFSCNKKEEKTVQTQSPIAVTVLPVQESLSNSVTSISGNVDGSKTVKIGFLTSGRITSIPAVEGSFVRSGQAVATINPINYDVANDVADIQMNQVNDEYRRLKIMHDRGSISDADFQKVVTARQQASQNVRLNKNNVKETRIYAPFSGVVIKKLAEKGEIIAQGMPVMVISDISSVNINAYIPESELKNIRIGQDAEVNVSALDQTIFGKITEVGGVADPASRTFTVKIRIPNPNFKIRPGMIADVKINSANQKSGLFVPSNALIKGENNQNFVYVADKNSGKAFRRNVSIGEISDNRIEIVSGLKVGENIVVAGQNNLVNGSVISIKN